MGLNSFCCLKMDVFNPYSCVDAIKMDANGIIIFHSKILWHICHIVKFKIEDIGKDTNKPFLLDLTILDEIYTCVFCNSLAFCESMCGACMFIVIGHLLSSMYNCLVVHVGFHNHPNVKGKNWKV
jgi:hypothetical protein